MIFVVAFGLYMLIGAILVELNREERLSVIQWIACSATWPLLLFFLMMKD